MSLKSYILKRLAYSVVLLFFALSLNFVIFRMAPGNPIQVVASGMRLQPEMVERLIELWGLQEPLHVQYIRYIRSTLTWDFGYSYNSLEPVSREIMERLPNTLLLMGVSLFFAIIFGTVFGIYAGDDHEPAAGVLEKKLADGVTVLDLARKIHSLLGSMLNS